MVGGLCFQDTQANWGTQFDSCFFLCKATRLNYIEAFPSFHFWSTNERCAFLLLIRNDTIYFCNHWVSKQQRQMAFFTPDRKPCALLESAYFFQHTLISCAWAEDVRGWFVPEQKTKSVLQLGCFLWKPEQLRTSVVFWVFNGLISLMFAFVFVLPS